MATRTARKKEFLKYTSMHNAHSKNIDWNFMPFAFELSSEIRENFFQLNNVFPFLCMALHDEKAFLFSQRKGNVLFHFKQFRLNPKNSAFLFIFLGEQVFLSVLDCMLLKRTSRNNEFFFIAELHMEESREKALE